MGEVRWGVIGNAKIGRDRVQPAIEASDNGRLVTVASRSGPVTYDALLERDDIDAVYIPCPTTCMSNGRARRWKPASTCCAKNPSPSAPQNSNR